MLHVLYNYVDLPLGRFTLQYILIMGKIWIFRKTSTKTVQTVQTKFLHQILIYEEINEHFYKTKKGQIQIEKKTLVEVKHASYIP